MEADYRGLELYDSFILWEMQWDERREEWTKVPLSFRTGLKCDPSKRENRTSAKVATMTAEALGKRVGFYFSRDDPFFFIDIDNESREIVDLFPGALTEVSQSGTGLHIIGTCDKASLPDNIRRKSHKFDLSFDAAFTEKRFVALTMDSPHGYATTDLCDEYHAFAVERLSGGDSHNNEMEWTTRPVMGPGLSDADIIDKALASRSAAATFGGRATFRQLWEADKDALAEFFPDSGGRKAYDASRADAALAQHLAFWTGKNCEQILRLMKMSALARPKWEAREDYYLPRTIARAVSRQENCYSGLHVVDKADIESTPEEVVLSESLPPTVSASPPPSPAYTIAKAEIKKDPVYVDALEQIKMFQGCVYIADSHKVLMKDGSFCKPDAFRALFGGHRFEMDGEKKVTKNAFTAFTESCVVDFPKVRGTFFDPGLPPYAVVDERINIYADPDVPCRQGDVSPLLRHIELMLPERSDQNILLDYMAACVQRPGDKFQWCPMVQGCEGNGKTFLGTVLRRLTGQRNFHMLDPDDVGNVFNGWIEKSIVVCVEEIFVNQRYEVGNRMKTMITNDFTYIHPKGEDQRSGSNCAKFILFSNHKDGVLKHEGDRRYAVFFTAQQRLADKVRCGMDDRYFRRLYSWIGSEDGIAAANHYFREREIHTDMMGSAPVTTSMREAIYESYGHQERVILEAMETGEVGLREGIVAAPYVDNALREAGYTKLSPKTRGRILQNIGYIPLPGPSAGKISIEGRHIKIYVRENSPLSNLSPSDVKRLYLKYNHASE